MKQLIIVTLILLSHFHQALAQEAATPKPIAPYSPAVMTSDGTLYLSGQIPRVPETGVLVTGDIKKATGQCMKNLGVLLKQHGLDYGDLVMVNIYMTDMDNYQAINEMYATFFKDGQYPARAAIQVGRLPMNAEVEISGIAKAAVRKGKKSGDKK
ncbi:MAG: Rid family detoxifying hydrolase [Bacteroidales bacterium]